jgi:predicted MPP superfamily phosphohydrolase
LRSRIAVFVVIVQSILLLAHCFIYCTWIGFRAVPDPPGITPLQAAVAILSLSFIAASLLAFRSATGLARWFYKMAAVWLGMVNFFFLGACLCWLVYGGAALAGVQINRSLWAAAIFSLAAVAGVFGVINARWLRWKRVKVELPNLPAAWRGRVAALVSDVHLGHVNGSGFLRRIVARLARLKPDVVFITGDLYDGTKVNPLEVASPWNEISPPHGKYFVTGNHEEFRDPSHYLDAVRRAGVRVLHNEKVDVDGLQIVGVPFHDSIEPNRFAAVLQGAAIDRDRPSVLLSHAPHRLSVPAEAGISLQLSGHTHGGQIFPFTWFTQRIFGAYTYGLKRFGEMWVYTTYGAGTWGPPMRVGTWPEVVLIEFA